MPGMRSLTISISRSIEGCPIHWKSARRLSASCSSRVRFEVRITAGRRRALIVPISGIVIWKSESTSSRNASNSSSARSISSISSTTGSSESIASSSARRIRKRFEKSSSSETLPSCAARRCEELARVVPLVHGVRDVEPLVALQPDQARVRGARERLGRLGLADAGLALEQEWFLERQREEERGRETAVRQVVGGAQRLLQLVDVAEGHDRRVIQNAEALSAIDHRSLPRAVSADYIPRMNASPRAPRRRVPRCQPCAKS